MFKQKKKLSIRKTGKPFKSKGLKMKIKPKSKVKPTKDFGKMSVDEFLNKQLDNSDDDEVNMSDEEVSKNGNDSSDSDMSDEVSNKANGVSDETLTRDEEQGDENDESNESDAEAIDINSHKESLAKLQETDPEFYKFLQENDKNLLDFNLSDDDKDDEQDEDVHKPTGDLDVASDESDFEADENDQKQPDKRVITLKMLKSWQNEVHTDKTNKTITCLIRAFHAAVVRVSTDEQEEPSHYKVDGSSVFNGVIQLCVLELGPALRKFLGLTSGSKQAPHKCKRFVKIKSLLRGYFVDLLKILGGVTSPNILNVILKHLHYISPMIVSFGNVTKPLLKKLISLWGTTDDTVRVISFLCILRITNNQRQNLLDTTLKTMYMTYVKNSKFVSTTSLPMINFMRRSLVEMFALDVNIANQHVFLYIRQLAIHLRNAITVNKKENIQAVYNWQFINSMRLWGNLLSLTCDKPALQSLIYPLVQVCIGTIKLIPTTAYYPLRFHIVQILMDLSRDTNVFIPILPFLLEILTTYDFNKKHQKVSMKPIHFTCVLRLSKSQMLENGFKDALIDMIYAQLLEYLSAKSHSIAFPDLSLLCVINLKQFVRKCSVASYCRKMRQLLEKIEENNKFIIKQRKNITFELKDFKQIEAWETTIKNNGTPLKTYYESWNKLRNIKKSKQATNNEAIGDYDLPTLKKVKRAEKKDDGQVELFPSDSESESENEVVVEKDDKPRRGKRGGKNVKKIAKFVPVDVQDDDDVDGGDIVEDLKLDDW